MSKKVLKKVKSFTPGPWNATFAARTRITIHSDKGEPVATVPFSWKNPEENARLIAAAPDMYEALKEAEITLKAMTDGSCLLSILDAIAKAEGTFPRKK